MRIPGIFIGNAVGNSSSLYWNQTKINNDCLFYASHPTDLLSKVSATKLLNQVTGSSDWLTVTGTGLAARYRTPNTASYKTADSDYVFWKTDGSESTCDGNRLIGYDFPRILVKYLNISPYTILAIAILKPGVTVTNGMRDAFDLSVWWDNTLSAHGNVKQNRGIGQSIWTAETVFPNTNWLARWDLNGNVNDTSGQNKTLTLTDATLTTDRNNVADKAYDFNGTSAFLDRTAIIPPTDVFSFGVWFKQDSLTNFAALFGDTNFGSYDQGFLLYQTATGLRFFVGIWNTQNANSNFIDIALTDTASWHFACCMYSKVLGKMYFSLDDGELFEAAVDYTLVLNWIQIGKGFGPSYFNGKIDKIYFQNKIWTPAEITMVKNETT